MSSNRRAFLSRAPGALALGTTALRRAFAEAPTGAPQLPEGAAQAQALEALPGKLPLIKKTWRPPNFETPVAFFEQPFTPNNAFFVRYHLAHIPAIDATQWALRLGGDAIERPLLIDMASLRRDFESVEVNALCLCSGNRRGFSDPHVPGIQWGHGAMGNARWRGVRLKEVLSKAGIKKDALEVVFNGADNPVLDKTPDFIKSLPMWKALDENTLLAYEINGEALPHWNGFPLRVVVPGWTATYWIKHVDSIAVVTQPHKGFWMATGYRIPKGRFPIVDRFMSQEGESNTPITEIVVSSLITTPQSGARLDAAAALEVKGVAWDGGYGIAQVLVSIDGGESWRPAQLGPDLGRYAWRAWRFVQAAPKRANALIMARAINRQGATQTDQLLFNPAGYHNNVLQKIPVEFL